MRWLCRIIAVFALAGHAAAEPKIEYTKLELANGLRVYVIEDHKAPVVDEIMWVRVGSKDELPRRTGFAHLFEHMMFKGSAHLPDGLMDRLLEQAGGYSTAYTNSDETVYINVAASNFFEQMMWIEADRLAGLSDTLDQAKLDNQRSVVLNERRQSYENKPYGLTSLYLNAALWPKQFGYRWPTIGYVADLEAATIADVKAFFASYYVPNNITMVIAGDVKPEDVERVVTKYFGWIPRSTEPARPAYAPPAPLAGRTTITATDDVKASRVVFGFRAPAQFTTDEPAAALALAILGDGRSSRLSRRLVFDAKLAQDVDISPWGRELGAMYTIAVTLKPGRAPAQVVAAISEELGKLGSAPPDAGELERAVNSREAGVLTWLEQLSARAIQLARYDVRLRDPDYFAKDLSRFRTVTPQQVTAAAARYLTWSSCVVLTISPGAKPTMEPQ